MRQQHGMLRSNKTIPVLTSLTLAAFVGFMVFMKWPQPAPTKVNVFVRGEFQLIVDGKEIENAVVGVLFLVAGEEFRQGVFSCFDPKNLC